MDILSGIDFPNLTFLGWTVTDKQWSAAVLVVIGIIAALGTIALARRARGLAIAAVVAGAVAVVWLWLRP